MDVYGTKPANDSGEYFRNNVWWWRPLWDYCEEVYPKCKEISGHTNDGDGFGEAHALQLSQVLKAEIESGRTAEYATARELIISLIERPTCRICEGTGQRPDGLYGVEWKQKGCNSCHGEGTTSPAEANYPFSVENVQQFAEFLEACGGFEIC